MVYLRLNEEKAPRNLRSERGPVALRMDQGLFRFFDKHNLKVPVLT
jgi:hypothetical protein